MAAIIKTGVLFFSFIHRHFSCMPLAHVSLVDWCFSFSVYIMLQAAAFVTNFTGLEQNAQ